MTASYYRYWGKARQEAAEAGPAYHLLPYHCLDVAAVAIGLVASIFPVLQEDAIIGDPCLANSKSFTARQ